MIIQAAAFATSILNNIARTAAFRMRSSKTRITNTTLCAVLLGSSLLGLVGCGEMSPSDDLTVEETSAAQMVNRPTAVTPKDMIDAGGTCFFSAGSIWCRSPNLPGQLWECTPGGNSCHKVPN